MKKKILPVILLCITVLLMLASCEGIPGFIESVKPSDKENHYKDVDMKAVYSLYCEYANQPQDELLSYEDWFDFIHGDEYTIGIIPEFQMNDETRSWEVSHDKGNEWNNMGFSTEKEEHRNCRHEFSEWVVIYEANEYFPQIRYRECRRCGYKELQFIKNVGDDHKHIYTENVTLSTCTSQGYTTHTCTCGDSYVDSYVDAIGHSYGDWIDEVPATCTKDGKLGHYHCSVCEKDFGIDHKEITDVIIKTKGHSFGEWYETKAPTCTEKGEERRDCKECKYHETRDVKETGHSYTTVVTPPTCTEKGYTTYTCHCGYSYIGSYVDVTGHNYENNICTGCGNLRTSEGLKFTLSDDGTYYILSGIGTCTDTEIIIPNCHNGLPVVSIAPIAFCEQKIVSITIPDSVIQISDSAFYDCTELESIKVNEKNKIYHSKYDCLIENATNTLILGSENSIIPDYVTAIGRIAFAGRFGLKSITIPDSVTSIGESAFDGCLGLTSVIIGNGVTSIGDSTFRFCRGLTSVTIGNSVTSIGESAFYNCESLTSIVIPNSVTSIGETAFHSCKNLANIIIPNSVTSIGEGAFFWCESLTSVTIGSGVKSIGDQAFCACYRLVEVYNLSGLSIKAGSSYNSWVGCYAKVVHTSKDEESSIKNANDFLFITDENGINYLFGYVGNETDITLPNNFNGESYQINDYAFYNCTGLTGITIPDSVISIGNHAFEGTTYCKDKNNWDNGVLYIGNHLIIASTSITGEYVIKNGTITIAPHAFSQTYLTSITIPDSVTSIGDHAFIGSATIKTVTIGNGVTSIGENAFYNCTNLTTINYTGTEEQWNAISKVWNWNSNSGNYTINFNYSI